MSKRISIRVWYPKLVYMIKILPLMALVVCHFAVTLLCCLCCLCCLWCLCFLPPPPPPPPGPRPPGSGTWPDTGPGPPEISHNYLFPVIEYGVSLNNAVFRILIRMNPHRFGSPGSGSGKLPMPMPKCHLFWGNIFHKIENYLIF